MKPAIDFGTCFSLPMLRVGGMIFDFERAEGIPTLYMYNPDEGKDIFGYECKNGRYALYHPGDVIRNVKTLLRTNPSLIDNPNAVVSGGKSFSYREIVKKYLAYLIDKAKENSKRMANDDSLQGICITAPVSSGTNMMLSTEYRRMLEDVIEEITGLEKDKIFVIGEPEAAGLHYFYGDGGDHSDTPEQTVLVFDLGGGTLDLTVMSYKCVFGAPSIEIKKVEGDPALGGNDWDKAFGDYILSKVGINPERPSFMDEIEENEFREKVVAAKHDLSVMPRAMLSFGVNGKIHSMYVTAAEFEKATAHLLDRAMKLAQKIVGGYDGDIDKVVLVGGSSNMPQIKEGLDRSLPGFSRDDILLHEPSKAIAKGAAIYLGIENAGGSFIKERFKGIAEASYGWISINSSKTPQREMIYFNLFKETPFENNTISVDVDSGFVAVEDNQSAVTFRVYEATSVLPSDCEGGHWLDFGEGQRNCGIQLSIPVPEEYRGRATQFVMYPRLILDRKGILRLEVYDSNGKCLDHVESALHS